MERVSEADSVTGQKLDAAYLRLAQQIALVALASEIAGISRKHAGRVLTLLEKHGMLTPQLRKVLLDSFGDLHRDIMSLLIKN